MAGFATFISPKMDKLCCHTSPFNTASCFPSSVSFNRGSSHADHRVFFLPGNALNGSKLALHLRPRKKLACSTTLVVAISKPAERPVESIQEADVPPLSSLDSDPPSVAQSATLLSPPHKLHVSGGSNNTNRKVPLAGSAGALFCDYLEKILVWMFADSHVAADGKPSPHSFLTGYFAPVAGETDPTSGLTISGSIPECLNGEFVQVAPNPRFNPVSKYHWFDGDGILHGLNIKDGKATYVARFIKTSKLQQEEYYGAAKFVKVGDIYGTKGMAFGFLHNLRVKLGVLDISNGQYLANTGLVYHNKKLLALHEGDRPYLIKVLEDGDLETIGREDYGAFIDRLTAHPKIDPVTGEMFGFCWTQAEPPYLIYHKFSKEGVVSEPVPITIPECVMIHDFAITKNYAIFLDLSLTFNEKHLVEGKHILHFDPSKESRLGLLPRYAKNESQIRWFTIPPCVIFHTVNAWEEDDEVVLIACRMPTFDFTLYMDFDKDKYEESRPQLYEFKMNLKTGQATQRQLSMLSIEFPKFNENYMGRKQRYVYGSIFDKELKVIGVVKFDLALEPELNTRHPKIGGNIIGLFLHGDGRRGSEPLFVPRVADKGIPEDDGYLICFVYDENKGCVFLASLFQLFQYSALRWHGRSNWRYFGCTHAPTGRNPKKLHLQPHTSFFNMNLSLG